MSIADFFFGRKQNSTNSRRSVKLNRNAVRTRTLSMEPLETRDLLSVTTGLIDDSAYSALRELYPDFNLPVQQSKLNVMVVDLDEGATELKLEDLKTAITEAGTTTQPDLILVKTSASANSVTYTSNEDEITIDINSSRYGSVTIIGWGDEYFTLDANQQCRVMAFSGELTVVNLGGLTVTGGRSIASLSNTYSNGGGGIYNSSTLTITNCTIYGNGASVRSSYSGGGGIYNSGTLMITNSSISENTASGSSNYPGGGGIYNYRGSVTVIDSVISGNRISVSSSDCGGGGIYNFFGTFSVTNTSILQNTASGSAISICGGGIYNLGNFTATNSTISGNITSGRQVSSGGGIYNSSGSLILTNCIISGNTASLSSSADYGGGIFNVYNGSLTIINSTISGNTASDCGGICNGYNGSFTIINSTIYGNLSSSSSGCGISHNSGLMATITNSTISGNTGGGIAISNGAPLTVTNSIVSRNYSGNISGNLSLKSSNNLIGDYYPGFVCGPVFDSDGKLANADTIDLHLRSDSIAIDMGDNSFIANYEIDVEGNERVYGGTVDIGAYEYQDDRNDEPIPYSTVVNTLNDSFDLNDDEWSLREAIFYAQEYVTITFADELEGTIYLTLGQLDVETPLTVDGNNRITIDGGKKYRVFYVSSQTEYIPVILNGLTIQNGNCIYYFRADDVGSGIYNSKGSLMVINCTISGNTASSQGGGIYNYGILTIANSKISENTATNQGGGIYNNGTLTVTNSEISGNTSTSGGGIENYGTLTVTNCTISGNSTDGISNPQQNGTLTVINSIVSNNYGSNVGVLSPNSSNNLIGGHYPGFVCSPVFSSDGKITNADSMDLHLRCDSIAIDKGDNNAVVDIETDNGGSARIFGGTVDIGAYEYQGDRNDDPIPYSTVVNTLNDSFDLNDDEWSLREAIYYIPEYAAITFSDELEGTIVLTLGQLKIESPLAIDGKNRIVIDGNQKSGAFYNLVGTEETPVILNGLTIQNGSNGISNVGGNFMITNCTISGNSNRGISNGSGNLMITNCSITDNIGDGISNTDGNLTVTNCTISGNALGYGGAITNLCNSAATTIVTITNCSITDNIGDGIHSHCNGDGIATITVANSTIVYNAQYGIYNYGTINVNNTIVACNISNDLQYYSGTVYGNNNLSSYTGWYGNDNIEYDSNSPLFVNVAKSDYRLAANSQAIDKGNNQFALDAELNELSTDLAGNSRFVGTNIDIGAYEYHIELSAPTLEAFAIASDSISVSIGSVPNATGYTLQYATNSRFTNAESLNVHAGSNTISNLKANTRYYFRVKANGTGDYADSVYSSVQSTSIDDILTIQNDFVKTALNSPVVINYRANDEVSNWSATTVQFGEASHGECVFNEDGTITYTPESGFYGTDVVSYILISPFGTLASGAISIRVGLPIATSVQKTSSNHSPSTAIAPSVDSLTDWENCCVELWAQGVNELNSGETTVTLEYNPAVYEVPYFSACADGVALAASEGVVLPNGNVEIQLTVHVLEPLESQTDNLFLGTVVLAPSFEEDAGVEDVLTPESVCVLDGSELTTTVEAMPYDLVRNGAIDVNDFVAFATVFGTNLETMSPDNPLYAQAVKADFNNDKIVNVDDFVMFAIKFGATKKRVEIPAAQASAAADSGNKEWEAGNGEVIDSQVETPVAQSATPNSQLVTRNSQLEVESSMTLLEAFSAALLDLYDNQESFDQAETSAVLAESRTELPVASYSDDSSQNTLFDAVDAVLEEDLLAIDWE